MHAPLSTLWFALALVLAVALFDDARPSRPTSTTSAAPVAPTAPASPDDALRARAVAAGLRPLPASAPAPGTPQVERIALGAQLFFEPRLSASGLISCHTCHNLGLGGDDNLPTSLGHGWQAGPRNAPTVLNSVYNAAQFWDGRAPDLATQAKGPIQAAVEMANTPERVVRTLASMPEYVARFRRAFPDAEEPLTFDHLATAIAAFEETLTTPGAPFDRWLAGADDALEPAAKEGLARFVEQGCIACHTGVNVGGQSYFPFGLVRQPSDEVRPPHDLGRFAVTQVPSDRYAFRVAPLRNVALTAPYFHSGQVWELERAIAIMGAVQLGRELAPADIDRIAAFLRSLTGPAPRIAYPTLPVETATTPKPRWD